MAYQNIILEKDKKDKRIARLILNRPDKMNALSEAMLSEIFSAVDEVDKDDEVVALIIKGAGRAFSSGYELSSPAPSGGGQGGEEVDGGGEGKYHTSTRAAGA